MSDNMQDSNAYLKADINNIEMRLQTNMNSFMAQILILATTHVPSFSNTQIIPVTLLTDLIFPEITPPYTQDENTEHDAIRHRKKTAALDLLIA